MRRVPSTSPAANAGVLAAMMVVALLGVTAINALADRYSFGFRTGENAFEYAIGEGKTLTMSTSSHHWEAVRRVTRRYAGDVMWFALAGRSYVVSDDALVANARRIVAPMNEVGERQERLGTQQDVVGNQQEALGEEQERVGERMSRIGDRINDMPQRERASRRRELAALQRELERLQQRQDELNERQRPLIAKQRELGRQHAILDREQERVAAAAADQLEKLAREALRNGKAERVAR